MLFMPAFMSADMCTAGGGTNKAVESCLMD